MKFIQGFLILVMVMGCPAVRCAESISADMLELRWITQNTQSPPKLNLVLKNSTSRPLQVRAYQGKPIVQLDFWYDYEGIVLIDADQYRVLLGGFVVLKPLTIQPGKSFSVELDLSTFVPFAGDHRGSSEWLTDFANAQAPRVVARIEVDGVERQSVYAFMSQAKGGRQP